ncbi:MAG: hypothetical protein GY813_16985, partial [Halieaceae bacterium]|nr:hypothetical protein [Halieaceae bacterium]
MSNIQRDYERDGELPDFDRLTKRLHTHEENLRSITNSHTPKHKPALKPALKSFYVAPWPTQDKGKAKWRGKGKGKAKAKA